MNAKLLLKILIWAIVMHVILIALSIGEVFVYSTLIDTGKDEPYYREHANTAGPYISAIFGFLLVFFIGRKLIRKHPQQYIWIGLLLPGIYEVLDIAMLLGAGMDYVRNASGVILVCFLAKMAAGFLLIVLHRKKERRNRAGSGG